MGSGSPILHFEQIHEPSFLLFRAPVESRFEERAQRATRNAKQEQCEERSDEKCESVGAVFLVRIVFKMHFFVRILRGHTGTQESNHAWIKAPARVIDAFTKDQDAPKDFKKALLEQTRTMHANSLRMMCEHQCLARMDFWRVDPRALNGSGAFFST